MVLDGVMTYTSLNNMGGMGIMQFAEYNNVALVTGLDSALGAIGAVPRLRAEIKAMLDGKEINNPILSSMEMRGGGGEFGLEGYRMVSGFDTTGREFATFGQESAGPVTRLLKRGQYALGTVTLHRAVQSVQQRGVAEQITLKALRMFKDGSVNKSFEDMGFTRDLKDRIARDLPNAVEWNGNRVKSFDITKFTDHEAREAFRQAVWRGTYQTIQGTFIGERGWWAHSNVGRFLTQFRNYPITAMEKPWKSRAA